MSDQLTVVAQMRAKPGRELRLREELERLLAPTRAEKGCINYDLHRSLEAPTLFMFHENWASEVDLDAHLRSPHLQALLRLMPELIDGQIEITKWEKVK